MCNRSSFKEIINERPKETCGLRKYKREKEIHKLKGKKEADNRKVFDREDRHKLRNNEERCLKSAIEEKRKSSVDRYKRGEK